MPDKPKYTQAQIDDFKKALHQWSGSLPQHQQDLLGELLNRGETSGALSPDELESLTGRLAKPAKKWIQED